MRIDVDRQAVLCGLAHDGVQVVEILVVILTRPGVLDRFPGDDKAQKTQPPGSQPAEVLIRPGERKRPPDKGQVAMLAQVLPDLGCAVRYRRDLRASPQIHAAQKQRTTHVIF